MTHSANGVWSGRNWRDLYPFESHWLDTPAGKFHYVDEGTGPVVLCLHGNPSWSFLWRDVVKQLRHQFRVIVPDHMGCGLSDRPSESQYGYSLKDRVADVERLIDHVKPDGPVHLLMHDWGGMIGMTWASKNPARVNKIGAFNTAGFMLPAGKAMPLPLRILRGFPRLARWATLGGNLFAATAAATCTEKALPPQVRDGFLAPYDRWSKRLATHLFVQDIPAKPGDAAYELAHDTDTRLSTRFEHHPLFLGWGLRDYVFDGDFLAEWVRRFPKAEVHAFANAGHYVLEDAGDVLIPAIHEFLSRA